MTAAIYCCSTPLYSYCSGRNQCTNFSLLSKNKSNGNVSQRYTFCFTCKSMQPSSSVANLEYLTLLLGIPLDTTLRAGIFFSGLLSDEAEKQKSRKGPTTRQASLLNRNCQNKTIPHLAYSRAAPTTFYKEFTAQKPLFGNMVLDLPCFQYVYTLRLRNLKRHY